MSAWTVAIEQIQDPESAHAAAVRQVRLGGLFKKKLPITITGAPGSGKTQLFGLLTGKTIRSEESAAADTGYARTTRRRQVWSVRTIPGAASENRSRLTDRLFDSGRTQLYGLVHVVSYGFNTVWDGELALEGDLQQETLEELRRRQLRKELADFEELADLITRKTRRAQGTPTLWPSWLLVAVNKADLFWSEIDRAGEYYLPGSESPFDDIRQQVTSHFGGLFDFRSEVLPIALSSQPFRFAARRMDLTVPSQLTSAQANISAEILARRLEGLSGF